MKTASFLDNIEKDVLDEQMYNKRESVSSLPDNEHYFLSADYE